MKKTEKCSNCFELQRLFKIMKVVVLLMILCVTQVFANSIYSQDKKLSLKIEDSSLETIFKRIESESDFHFFYKSEDLIFDKTFDVDIENATIFQILDAVLSKVNLSYKVFDKYIAVSPSKPSNYKGIQEGQQKTIRGIVTDSEGEPIPGVTVTVKGTTTGTITDMSGAFELFISSDAEVLVFSFIGMKSQEVVLGDQTRLEVTMQEEIMGLDEVVVVGYGTQKKKLITGATSQVNTEELTRQNTVSAIDALKSNTAGMQIVKTSGQPGSGYRINIRGLGTTGDASPLFIVDGVPVEDIEFLNPSEIESIDILKDAASAAIYGSRSANGVVLVTTKSGKFESKPTITYDGYYGVQNLFKKVPTLNAQEYATMMNEARMNDGLKPFDFAALVPDWEQYESGDNKGTDWLDEILVNDAPVQNHAVGIAGGTEKSNYSLGFSYTSQDGILGKPVASSYERYNVRINTEHIIFENDNYTILKVGETFAYSSIEKSGIATGGMYSNTIRNVLSTHPFMPVYDENGEFHDAIPWDIRVPNPVGIMVYTQGNNVSESNKLIANGYVEFQPLNGLKLRSSFGYDFSSGSYRSYTPEYNLSERHFRDYSSTTHSLSRGRGYNFENTINYVFESKSGNSVDLLAGTTVQKNNIGESISGTNINSIFDDLEHAYLSNSTTIDPARTILDSYPWGENMLLSYFGRVNYDYNEKYMATLVMRADGSSKFAEGNRWGYFPSVAAGWVASSEDFLSVTRGWLPYFKIRASWGQNGNQNISPFQYLSTISFSGADHFGIDKKERLTGAYPNILPNPEVTWETSEQLNVGVDARILDDNFSLNFDWYIKTTKDWLVAAPTLASYGTGAPYINGGDVENRGFELSLSWRDKIGDFSYFASANVAHNENKVTRIDNYEKIIHGPINVLADLTSEMFRAEEGYPIGYFWGYKTDGIFQNEEEVQSYVNSEGEMIQPDAEPGDVRFVNTNGDNVINDDDKVMIGDPNPDYTFGINLGADYKGFDFSISASGVAGNQIIRSYRDFAIFPTHNFTTDIFNRWHGEGTSNRLPKLSTSSSKNFSNISDLYVEDADYLRITNFSVGYDFKNLIRANYFGKLRAYIAVQNLYTFTEYSGMDPEVGYSGGTTFGSGIDLGFYPSPRTVLFGVNIEL